MPLPPWMSRAIRAISSALPQLLRLSSDTAGGAARPCSNSRPSRSAACRPSVISVCMSASFFWMSWLAASGRPNCLRSSAYWRARCQQNSAAPIAPQAMPARAMLRQPKGPPRPLAFGSTFSSGTNASSSTISPVIGLGEAEATDDLARCEFRQIALALRFAAIGEDRMHHERGLHRHGGAVAGIDPLDLARDQPVGDIAEARAAVFFRDRGSEQAERAHLGDDGAIETLLAVVHEHAWEQLVLRIAARGLAHHALFLGELAFEIERILPVEGGVLAVRRRAMP